MAQLVEHILGKDEVPSSNLGSSSRHPGALMSIGALVLQGNFSVAIQFSLGKDTPPSERLILKSPSGLFTVRIWVAAKDTPVL